MTRAGAIKLSILIFLIFILCLPEFFPQVSQIQFLCETFHPCTPENGSGDVHICGQTDLPCMTHVTNGSSQDGPTGWYLCETERSIHALHDNTSVSGEHVTVVLTLKTDNLSEGNVSVFVYLNHTDLYTGPQKYQRLFYCFLPLDKSKCPMNMSTEEPTKETFSPPTPVTSTLKSFVDFTSAKPVTFLLKKTTLSFKETSSLPKLNCQPTSSSYLFHYQTNNQTETSTTFPKRQTNKESWWCEITAVWFILVLTLIALALISVGFLIFKSRRIYPRKSHLVAVSAGDDQLKEISEQRGNSADVLFTVCSVGDDDVFSEISSTVNKPDEHLLKVYASCKRRLSPIYEITENSLDEGRDEDEEEDEWNISMSKQEFKETQGHCEPSTHLHYRSNPSCSCHETDGEL